MKRVCEKTLWRKIHSELLSLKWTWGMYIGVRAHGLRLVRHQKGVKHGQRDHTTARFFGPLPYPHPNKNKEAELNSP